MVVSATAGEQLSVGATLDDAALVEDEDLVDPVQAGEPVGDQQRGLSGGRVEQVVEQCALGGWIEIGGRLIQHEQRPVGQEGAGERDALARPGRQQRPALGHDLRQNGSVSALAGRDTRSYGRLTTGRNR
jgi:hypothetical protein